MVLTKKIAVPVFLSALAGISILSVLVLPPKTAAQTDTCVTSKCHQTMGKDKFVHNPVKEGMCAMCHMAAEDPEKKTKHPGNLKITLSQQGADLCYQCHDAKNKKKVVHAPIQGGDCSTCHNPHQSANRGMLREKEPQICYQCHPDSMAKQKVTHAPVAAGNCSSCHDNHQSDIAGRLLKDGNDLCLGCHAKKDKEIKAAKVVHPAVSMACTSCHHQHGSANKAMLKTGEPGLCFQCHNAKNNKKVVHAPIQGGDCSSCHNPHYSQNKGMLTQATPDLCFQCHVKDMMKQKVMHPPVLSGDCSGCHDNHQSDFAGRLTQQGNALCALCHPDKDEGIKTKKTVHYPVKQSCLQCHNQHGSPNKAMLSATSPSLCANCHPNEVNLGKRSLTRHGPMEDSKTCMNCHDPHFADQPRLLPKAQLDLCLSCHDKQLDTEKGKIMDMKSHLAANKNGHGPVKSGDCVSCHNPHGSDAWRLLAKYYPPDFYTSYSDGKYALCFLCHDKSAFRDRFTSKATQFRDGERNLHFLHVNKAAKGRTCRSCHEVHADSGLEHHVANSVGFSYWSMPMNFIPAKDGGSCAPGCHGEKRYKRK